MWIGTYTCGFCGRTFDMHKHCYVYTEPGKSEHRYPCCDGCLDTQVKIKLSSSIECVRNAVPIWEIA